MVTGLESIQEELHLLLFIYLAIRYTNAVEVMEVMFLQT